VRTLGLIVVLTGALLLSGCSSPGAAPGHALPPSSSSAPTTTGVAAGPAVSCATIDLSAVPGSAAAATATLGTVSAKLAGTRAVLNGSPALADPELSVTVGTGAARSVPLALPDLEGSGTTTTTTPPVVQPFPIGPDQGGTSFTAPQALCVARFGATSPVTAVLVGVNTGGAHCCTVLDAYTLASDGLDPAVVQETIGDPAVTVETVGGAAVLKTADDAFAYQFSSYAGSGMPVKALELRGRNFVDTTTDHLDWVSTDAANWWSVYQQNKGQSDAGLGVLAPWVADECLLGKASSAWSTVQQLQSQGALASSEGDWPSGAAYVSSLRQFLVQHHYCPAGS